MRSLVFLTVLLLLAVAGAHGDTVAGQHTFRVEGHQWVLKGPDGFLLRCEDGPGIEVILSAGGNRCVAVTGPQNTAEEAFRQFSSGAFWRTITYRQVIIENIRSGRRKLYDHCSVAYRHRIGYVEMDPLKVDLWKGQALMAPAEALRALRATDWHRRSDAVVTLAASAEAASLPQLESLASHDPQPLVRLLSLRAALRIAFDLQDLAAVQRLMQITGPIEAPAMRLMAAESTLSWAAAGRRVPASLLTTCRGAAALVVSQAVLASCRDDVSPVLTLSRNPDGLIRVAALMRLARLEGSASRQRLLEALRSDPNPHARFVALEALRDDQASLMPVCQLALDWARAQRDTGLIAALERAMTGAK